MIGKRFERLTVLKYVGKSKWLCKCDCGNETEVYTGHLNSGGTKSCGCYRKWYMKKTRTRHGMSHTPIHEAWGRILERCYNPKKDTYQYYGGRGIKVCERWHTFENFYADMGDKPEGMTIDRVNNDGDYEPGNCRWATTTENNRNRRNSLSLTLGSETKTMLGWAEYLGVNYNTLHERKRRGWSDEEILTTPVPTRKYKKRTS